MPLDIYPGEGIGPIRLGMHPTEVLEVFTEPRAYEAWMGGNLNDALLFSGLRLHFSQCDSRAPLPESQLNWIVIHQRTDAYLFDRKVEEWTKESLLTELHAYGYDVELQANGDICVPDKVSLSFEEDGRLVWVEI